MAQYQVKSGDTLSKIAQQYGYGGDYISIAKANNIANPNRISIGQMINIPDRQAPGKVPASPELVRPEMHTQTDRSNSWGSSASLQSSGPTPDGIPISQLPPDLVWNGQLDVSNPVKKAKYDQLVSQYKQNNPGSNPGSSIPTLSLPKPPTIDLSSIYAKSLEEATKVAQPGIDASMAEVTAVQNRINEKRRQLAAKEAEIGDNPFLSEASMTGRLAKLRERANQDIAIDETEMGIAQNKSALAQNKLSQAKADAQVKLNIASQQYNIESDQYKQNLSHFTDLLSSGALNSASGEDLGQIAVATGMSTSMIQSIVDASKAKNAPKPELRIADDGTNQYVVAIDPSSGNVINRQVVSASAPKSKSSGSGNDAKKEAAFDKAIADGLNQLMKGENWGTVWNRIKSRFPEVPDILIDTGLGTQWRESGAFEKHKSKTKGESSNQLKLGGS